MWQQGSHESHTRGIDTWSTSETDACNLTQCSSILKSVPAILRTTLVIRLARSRVLPNAKIWQKIILQYCPCTSLNTSILKQQFNVHSHLHALDLEWLRLLWILAFQEVSPSLSCSSAGPEEVPEFMHTRNGTHTAAELHTRAHSHTWCFTIICRFRGGRHCRKGPILQGPVQLYRGFSVRKKCTQFKPRTGQALDTWFASLSRYKQFALQW